MLHRVEEDQILTMGKNPASQDDEQCSGKAEIDHTDRWSRLRASYCKMLEEYLDNLGHVTLDGWLRMVRRVVGMSNSVVSMGYVLRLT